MHLVAQEARTFSSHKTETQYQNLSFPPAPGNYSFLFLRVITWDILYMWNHVVFVFWWLVYFTKHNVKAHHVVYDRISFFSEWINSPLCKYIPYFLYPFIPWSFRLLTPLNWYEQCCSEHNPLMSCLPFWLHTQKWDC